MGGNRWVLGGERRWGMSLALEQPPAREKVFGAVGDGRREGWVEEMGTWEVVLVHLDGNKEMTGGDGNHVSAFSKSDTGHVDLIMRCMRWEMQYSRTETFPSMF
jgi:hypothetical protein